MNAIATVVTVTDILGKKIVRGMYDYVSAIDVATADVPDLNFNKGDVMEVLKEYAVSLFSFD